MHVFRWYSFVHGQSGIANCIGTALRKALQAGALGAGAVGSSGKANAKGAASTESEKKGGGGGGGEKKDSSSGKQASYEGEASH